MGRGGKKNQRRGKGKIKGGRQMKGKEREEKMGIEKEKYLKVMFWNVAGLKNKDREFWKSLEKWEMLVLIETWVEKKEKGKIKDKLPMGYEWKIQGTKKRNRKESDDFGYQKGFDRTGEDGREGSGGVDIR